MCNGKYEIVRAFAFWRAMKDAGVHPVIGLAVRVQYTETLSLPLIIYAKTNEGYKNLLKISSSISIRQDEMLPWRWLVAYSKGVQLYFLF